MAQVVPPARAAFERLPAELELQQRGRTAIDQVVVRALRSAGKDVVANHPLGSLARHPARGGRLPILMLLAMRLPR